MYRIETVQDRYLTYVLKDELSPSRLAVVPERGGIITQWWQGDCPLLYLDAERFGDPGLSVRGGIPQLFPICGNLPDNQFFHQGHTYSLKQHGFARDLPWAVVAQETEGRAALTLELTSSPQTLGQYPFPFRLRVTYGLRGQGLSITHHLRNLGRETMPYSLGLHPYFAVGDKSQIRLDLPAPRYQDQKNQTHHDFSGDLDWRAQELDLAFHPLSRHQAGFRDGEKEIRLRYGDPYRWLVLWTLADKDYLCVEPWTGPRNAIHSGEGLQQLAPGAETRLTVEMTAIFG